MKKEDIQIISRHSNWPTQGVEKALKEHVYSSAASWKKFIQLLLMALGVGFTVMGILFFFAYNWDNLHRFAKLGLVEALIIAVGSLIFFSKLKGQMKDIILTGLSMIVGVLFAVYGQIYQTGANAYDFFLGWTIFVTIWAIVSNYPPLWLLYIVLLNTTFTLYTEQIAGEWVEEYFLNIVFVFNLLLLIGFLLLEKKTKTIKVPNWLTNILALALVSCSTIGVIIGIIDDFRHPFQTIISVLAFITYTGGLIYGYKSKRIFYLSIIPFSIIVILTAIFIRISNEAAMFFFVCVFVIFTITMLIRQLLSLQKKWEHGTGN